MEYVLIGNPNTGKTTFFNAISKSSEHVGNWQGVTNAVKEKKIKIENKLITFFDLPGVYSLSPLGMEEKVTTDFVQKNYNKMYINICDSENIKKNLYLTLCLIERKINFILVINNISGKHKIEEYDFLKKLNVDFYLINPKKKKEINNFKKILLNKKNNSKYEEIKYKSQINNYKIIEKIIKKYDFDDNNRKIFDFLELQFDNLENKSLESNDQNEIKKICTKENYYTLSSEKYKIINSFFENKNNNVKNKIDKILLNRFLCIPIFLIIILFSFYLTFNLIGKFLSDFLNYIFVEKIGGAFLNWFSTLSPSEWIFDLMSSAVVGGIGTILSFLPQIVLLELLLLILENSGYISRVAFIFDDLMKKFGLSGKSIYTILMGFGCSTSACMTARNMEEDSSKIKTALITPFMSCSAKLPIYLTIGGAIFGSWNILVICFLYTLGILVALLISFSLEKTLLPSKRQSFLMEMPAYRKVDLKFICKETLKFSADFLLRIGGVVLLANIVMFFLQGFDFKLRYVSLLGGESILQTFARLIVPVFIPLGFANWKLVSSLLSGFIAKEIVVSSLAVLCGGNLITALSSVNGSLFSSPAGVLSFLCFCLLYTPCVATLSVLKNEIGRKWTILGFLIQLLSAYLVSMLVLLVMLTFEIIGKNATICVVVAIALVIFVAILISVARKKKKCKICGHCSL